MTFGTVCDGIGCGHLAFSRAGFDCAWSFEIEAFPSAVLAHRFPDVKNYGDMLKCAGMIESEVIEAPDVFIGGTPCQAFSVAGKRKGLEDARGNLSLTFCGIADAIDDVRGRDGKPPCVILWENVPGVLSDKGNAFGCFLGELSGSGCELQPAGGRWGNAGCVFGPKRTVAWRVLDSQFFGVAQRRRRVFVVASAGDGARPEEILFEREGVRRDTAPSRAAGKGFAHDVGSGAKVGHWDGGDCHPSLCSGTRGTGGIAASNQELFSQRGSGLVPVHTTGAGYWQEGLGTLRARKQDSHENLLVGIPDICGCLSDGAHNGGGLNGQDAYTGRIIPVQTYDMRGNGDGETVGTLTGDHAKGVSDYTPVVCSGKAEEKDIAETRPEVALLSGGDVCRTLSARHDSSPCADRGQEIIAICDVIHGDKSCNGKGWNDDGSAYTLDTMATQGVAVAFSCKDNGRDATAELSPTLRSMEGAKPNGGGQMAVAFERRFVRTSGGQPSIELNPCLRADTNTGDGAPCVPFVQNTRDEVRLFGGDGQTVGAIPAQPGMKQQSYIATPIQVRRLTPRECERLQALPDDWTLIPIKQVKRDRLLSPKKNADDEDRYVEIDGEVWQMSADGPRYKGIGNGQTVSVMQWLARRIKTEMEGKP